MRRFIKGLLWVAGLLVVIALVLYGLVLDVWKIPDDPVLGASMAPTLSAGDTVLVLRRGTPGFGDLVRCPDPNEAGSYVVGRIAGVAGDVVETDGAELSVNGTRYSAESACTQAKLTIKHPTTGADIELHCDMVAMGGGLHARGRGPRGPLERALRTEVQPDTVFLLSDDRSIHDDSRDFGVQPKSLCKQRIVFRLWSTAGWSDDEARFTFIR